LVATVILPRTRVHSVEKETLRVRILDHRKGAKTRDSTEEG